MLDAEGDGRLQRRTSLHSTRTPIMIQAMLLTHQRRCKAHSSSSSPVMVVRRRQDQMGFVSGALFITTS